MKKSLFYLICCAAISCSSESTKQLPASSSQSRIVIATVVDYSKSYRDLVNLEGAVAQLHSTVARDGGSIIHIGIQDNSDKPVYLSRIDKLDTANTVSIKNIYEKGRIEQRNKKAVASYSAKLQQQIVSFIAETQKFDTSAFTDIQQGLRITACTVCEPIYTEGEYPYKRFVLLLSDLLHDPRYPSGKKHLVPVDFCGATILLVRPSPAITKDSLQTIFPNSDVHVFTTISDAILFINEHIN
jgi:hypothetical protein